MPMIVTRNRKSISSIVRDTQGIVANRKMRLGKTSQWKGISCKYLSCATTQRLLKMIIFLFQSPLSWYHRNQVLLPVNCGVFDLLLPFAYWFFISFQPINVRIKLFAMLTQKATWRGATENKLNFSISSRSRNRLRETSFSFRNPFRLPLQELLNVYIREILFWQTKEINK